MDSPTAERKPGGERQRKVRADEGGTSRERTRPRGARISAVGALLAAWTAFIVYGTLLPFRFTTDIGPAAEKARAAVVTLRTPAPRADVASNILLFLPWGLLFAGRPGSRAGRPGAAILGAAAGGFVLSGLVEGAQLFAPGRTPSLVDLGTNTLGAALGAAVGWPLARRAWPAWSPALARLASGRPLAALAVAAGLGLLADGLSPFDVSLDPGDLKAAIKRARPLPFGPPVGGGEAMGDPWGWGRQGVAWALVGGLFALAMKEAGATRPRALVAAVTSGGGLALLIEAAQLAITSRSADMTAAFFAACGSSAGAGAVLALPARRPGWWAGPALAAWAVAVALAAWTPPHLAPRDHWQPRWSQLVPFWMYYRHTDLAAIADLIRAVLGFVPLGALLAARHPRLSALRAAAVGLGLGLVLEAGQLALVDRTADVTDSLSAGAGAAVGVALCRWAESRRAGARPG